MKSIEILGAAGEVTGSAFLATSNKETKVLVDCGSFQEGKENDERNESLGDHDPDQLDAILISHAHRDHIGRLLSLHKYKTPIFMTPATKTLSYIAIKDAYSLSPRGLYPQECVGNIMDRIITVPYDTPAKVDGLTVTFNNANHILGSASIVVDEENGERTLFSGDIGNLNSPIIRTTKPNRQANVLVMETTYGDRDRFVEDPIKLIIKAVKATIESGGTLLIPAFAIDRTQIVLAIFKMLSRENILKLKNGKDLSVYLDSPMAIRVTNEAYANNKYRPLLNTKLIEQLSPFKFPELKIAYDSKDSQEIHYHKGPKIIISASGMMSGGRVMEHAADYLPDSKSTILLVGYSVKGTLSRQIVEIEKGKEVYVNGYGYVPVNATILQTSAFSAHSDRHELRDYAMHVWNGDKRLRNIILIHGEDAARKSFALLLGESGIEANVSLPKQGEKIDLYLNRQKSQD